MSSRCSQPEFCKFCRQTKHDIFIKQVNLLALSLKIMTQTPRRKQFQVWVKRCRVESVCDSPKSWVSGRPLKLVLFEQMNSEVVASAEALVANVALVASRTIALWTDDSGDEQERRRQSGEGPSPACRPRASSFGGASW